MKNHKEFDLTEATTPNKGAFYPKSIRMLPRRLVTWAVYSQDGKTQELIFTEIIEDESLESFFTRMSESYKEKSKMFIMLMAKKL